MTNRKSHTRFRLVPKSTTLDDPERPLRTVFQNACGFGAQSHHENLNEIRPILSMNLWQYKVCGDIRWGSLERGRQMTVGVSKTTIFSAFSRYFLEALESKANIIYRQPG